MTVLYRCTALLLLIAGSLMSQGSINTIPSWNGTEFFSAFGKPNTATYGQTINVVAGSLPIVSFAFEIGNCTASVSFRGEIYAWDGAKAIGAPLFESPITTLTNTDGFQLVTFNTGTLNLTPGAYVVFATTSRDQAGAPVGGCQWGDVADTAYPGGNFVFLNNGTDTSRWTAAAWGTQALDLAFQVNVAAPPSTVPVATPAASPATLLLGFAGVITLGLLGLSRYRIAR